MTIAANITPHSLLKVERARARAAKKQRFSKYRYMPDIPKKRGAISSSRSDEWVKNIFSKARKAAAYKAWYSLRKCLDRPKKIQMVKRPKMTDGIRQANQELPKIAMLNPAQALPTKGCSRLDALPSIRSRQAWT
ncbi:MAG TPA: hypothetical protein PLR47_02180 [Smithellaceae bacterium]|nr:hypothetical protein [Smithellaceae bacterium]